MRSKMFAVLALTMALTIFAGTGAAQGPAQNPPSPPAQSGQGQQNSGNAPMPGPRPMRPGMGPGTMRGGAMMAPDVMGMMALPQGAGENARRDGGPLEPLQRVSKLLGALDDPRVRTILGLTDTQSDGLRKIVVDTETFTITTGAQLAVDSITLRELLRADKPDRTEVMKKGDEISKATSSLVNHYLDAILAAKAILTPEQQKMIREYMENGAPALPTGRPRP